MRDGIERALNRIQMAGAEYGDLRFVHQHRESLAVKNGAPEQVLQATDSGFGIRVLVEGAWGFAASCRWDADEIDRVARQAVQIARASAMVKQHNVVLDASKAIEATYQTPVERDPFDVPVEKKLAVLTEASSLMAKGDPIRLAQAFFSAWKTKKIFASTAGAYIEQTITETGGGITATAVRDGELQVRSYPNSFRGNFATAGFEYFEGMQICDHAPRVAEEAVALLAAPQCPSGQMTVILDGGQLALQIHESIGHPIELDRVLGHEKAYAGDSFLTLDTVGRLKYGSPIVNVVADATVPGGLGTFGYDDEGVAAQNVPIITKGRFVGYLTSRETAPVLELDSTGAMRADGWRNMPLIRMTNVNLLPGADKKLTLEDLVASTDSGILMCTNRSWSIDNKRLNFQFGCEIGWEIENGKRKRIVKNPTYTGTTPIFWGNCDAICGEREWQMWGTPNCGKGQPPQSAHVGHGAAPARFRDVQVGVLSE